MEAAWQEAVFALYLAKDKIEPEVVENMSTWQHSGFSVDQSVLLPAGDQAGSGRLVQDVTRCLFSLARLVKVSDTGQVVYKAEKTSCRSFPDPARDGMQAGQKKESLQRVPPRKLAIFRSDHELSNSYVRESVTLCNASFGNAVCDHLNVL